MNPDTRPEGDRPGSADLRMPPGLRGPLLAHPGALRERYRRRGWGGRVGFEGFRFAETTRACVRRGARLVFHPQNNTTRPDGWKVPVHEAMVVTRAAEN